MDDDDVPVTRDERPSGRRDPPRPNLDHADTEPAVVETQPTSTLDAGRRYEMGVEIARGGMGRVLEARDTMLGRVVALKAALGDSRDAARRFAREVRVTARLEHPAIVPVYDAGQTADGLPYYVMRKIGGRPLDKLVRDGRTLDDRLALLPHVLAAVDAVAHAHARGILHRDLKPANILIGEHGETVVIDWGLAKVIEKHPSLDPEADDDKSSAAPAEDDDPVQTRAGVVVGTPGFIAPEQLRGDPATRCCDVYALGATLYHVLAGEPPHAARTSDEMISLALKGPPIPIANAADGVPHDLVTIVERAMAYDNAKRYADAAALGADLRRFLTGQLVAAHRYSRVERGIRFVKRHRAAAGVTAIAICVFAVLAYVSVTRIVRERNAADEAREVAVTEKLAAEAARAREAERANDLLVSQAAALVATNPTAAVGLLHQLPATATNWKKARDVLADARARGVPWVHPASAFTSGLVVGDGWAMSAGSDGVIRMHRGQKTKVVHRGTGNTRLALSSSVSNVVAVADETSIAWRLFESTRTPYPLARPVEHLAAGGSAAVFHDGHDLWRFTIEGAPTKIPIAAGKVFGLAMSDDGKYVVVNAQPEALVIELGATPRVIVRRPARSMEPAWSRDGKRLAVAQVQGLDEIDFSGTAPITRSITNMPNVQAAAYAGDDLYFTTGAQTAYRASAREGVVQVNLPPAIYSSATSTQDAAVFVSMTGLVAVIGRGGAIAIRGPTSRMFRAVGIPQSTKFAISVHEHLLEYDTEPMLPRSLEAPLENTTFHGFASNAHYVMGYMLEDWRLFDVATGTSRSLGRLEFGKFVASAPDGSYVLAHGNRSRQLFLMRPGGAPVPLGEASHAVAVSKSVAILASTRTVAEIDLVTGIARAPLWTADGEIRGLDDEGPYLAAATNSTLWRRDQRTGVNSTIALPTQPTAIDVASDGAVWIAAAHRVSRWNLDGSLVEVAQLTRSIANITHVTGIGCIAIDDRRAAYLIDDAKQVHAALPTSYELASLADAAPIVAGLTHDRRLAVYDLETRHMWTLGAGESIADISRDGRYIATYSGGRLSIFTVELPRDRKSYEEWRDDTTNLRVAEGRDELIWPRP